MSRFIDLTGKRFDRLIVVRRAHNDKWGGSSWLCKCDCGDKETIVGGGHLRNNHTRSCGCLQKEIVTKHGHSNGKTYQSWDHMIQRCNNPNYDQYKDYGGRGINVCERWMKFENFIKDMGERLSRNHSIERIDNNKGYYKSNCKWATRKEQQRNSRHNHLKTYNGKTQCLAVWAEEYNINISTLCYRIKNWTIEKALKTPVRKNGRN